MIRLAKTQLCILTALVLFSCQQNTTESKEPKQLKDGIYAPVAIKYATGLRIWKSDDSLKIQIRNPQDTAELIDEYIISLSTDSAKYPIQSFALGSTTIASYFQKLNILDRIDGLTFTDLVLNKALKGQIESGQVAELTSGGELDFEKVMALNPGCLLTYVTGSSNLDRIQEQGIDVFIMPEHLESTPLGRAEWIKMVGCLSGKLEEAKLAFNKIDSAYTALKTKAALSSNIPQVFTGSRYKDHWYAPGNGSYVAAYIRDAGGQYTFKEIEGQGSAELDMEAALKQMSQADFWGLVVSQDSSYTLDQLIDKDDRYKGFPSVKNRNVFVCNSKKADYFGDAVVQPEVVLADLIAILHPNILPNHKYIYFRPVS